MIITFVFKDKLHVYNLFPGILTIILGNMVFGPGIMVGLGSGF